MSARQLEDQRELSLLRKAGKELRIQRALAAIKAEPTLTAATVAERFGIPRDLAGPLLKRARANAT